LVDAVTDYAIYTLDANGCVTSWNAGAERMKGYGAAEIIGQSYAVFFPEADRQARVPEGHLQLAAEQGKFVAEGWRLRRDGSRFWASMVLTAIRDADSGLLGFAHVSRDISRRMSEEERRRQVVEAAPNAMVMVDRNGIIRLVNAQTERLFGYTRADLLGHPVEMLMPPQFRRQHSLYHAAFIAGAQDRPMGLGRNLLARRSDGQEFPVEIGLKTIDTEDGPMVLSAIVDISERRLDERFRLSVESAPNAMVMVNAAGLIEMVNAQTERLFGYPRAELLGQPVEMLVPERFRSLHPALRGAFFTAPQSRPMGAGRDLYARRRDGSEFPVEIGLNPIETGDGSMVLSAIVDISDRKQKEAHITAALREKDILLAEVHHRVKNNLQIIISLLDLQASRIDDARLVDLLRESQSRLRSMALIHQTLYESNDFAAVDFARFLNALVPMLASSYAADPGRVVVVIDAEAVKLPINLAIPCGLVVNELIANALKHAFPGERRGEIRVSLARAEPDRVTLTVSDDGVGMPDTVDPAIAETLGLQLVTLLAEQIGATLTIERGAPTSFTLSIPVGGAGK
jgi:PAS domain S-box-containing protein